MEVRLQRVGLLAERLAAMGHEVTWWTSTFDHIAKAQALWNGVVPTTVPNWSMRFVRAPGYPNNISLRRLVHNAVLGKRWYDSALREQPPDLIFAAMPTPESCYAAVLFKKRSGVPVVIDIRDLWPDDLVRTVAPPFQWAARLSLSPIGAMVRKACKDSDAIFAVSGPLLDWGLERACRARTTLDQDFPLAYPEESPGQNQIDQAFAFWSDHSLSRDAPEFVVCFFGTLGWSVELEPVIEAARMALKGTRRIRFVICGKGDKYHQGRALASDCPNITWADWVDRAKMWTLMRLSSAGLVPYQSIVSLMSNHPNKAIEYMAGGLPIVSSLQGMLRATLEQYEVGLTYPNGDPEVLYRHLCLMHDHPELRARMASNSANLFKARFSADLVYGRMTEALVEIAKRGRPRSGHGLAPACCG